jgi:hypothetical protein
VRLSTGCESKNTTPANALIGCRRSADLPAALAAKLTAARSSASC